MMKSEFEKMLGKEVSVDEYEAVENVYMSDGGMTKKEVVDLYKMSGLTPFILINRNVTACESKMKNMNSKLRLFRSVVDDGDTAFVSFNTATSKDALLNTYGGNGEFLKCEDVTASTVVDTDKLTRCLSEGGFNKSQIALVIGLVEQHYE